MQEKDGIKENKVEVLSELVENAQIFDSNGYSIVKITKGGESSPLKIPIKSTGVAEIMESLRSKAPRPPVIKELIKKNSPEGKEQRLPHDTLFVGFDNTDEKYIDDLEKHNQDFMWKVVISALNFNLKKADGTLAESYEDKKKILNSNGLTPNHLDQIFKDVELLTKFAEDREDFLSKS